MAFYHVKRDFGILNMNLTPVCHILHFYQDNAGFSNFLYQDRENYNFKNLFKKFTKKQQQTKIDNE